MVGILILGGAAIEYSIVGFPLQIYSAVSWLVLAFLVVITWTLFESTTQHSIILEPTGVTFVYPARARIVPWSRLQLSSMQTYPRWMHTVTFLEVGRTTGFLEQLAHNVTTEQAIAILGSMPNPPHTAFVQGLLAARGQTAVRSS